MRNTGNELSPSTICSLHALCQLSPAIKVVPHDTACPYCLHHSSPGSFTDAPLCTAQVAASYVNLAGLLKSENRLMEALPYFNKALDIRERAYGPDHPDVSAAQISLAELLKDLGK